MTFQSRELKKTASQKLAAAQNQKQIVLIYSGLVVGIGLINLLLQELVSGQIANTGGLANMGFRTFLSTVSTFLPVVCSILTLCLGFGYMGGMLRISRGQYASRNALRTGFERFWPLVRMKLLQGCIILGASMAAFYLSIMVFLLSPLSDSFAQTVEPYLSGGILLGGSGTIGIDSAALDQLSWMMLPILGIFLVVFLAFVLPIIYRYRMADFVLLDHPESGALYALRESRQMMRGNRFGLFRLDLSFWWYYVLLFLANALAYGDWLLSFAGLSLPLSSTAGYYLFALLSLAANFLVFYLLYNRLNVTYALAYGQVRPKEEDRGGAVLGNIFQM